MLQSIRDRTQGWFAGIIISLLILSFALWGVHSYFGLGSNNNVIATVNGENIFRNQLSAAYERLRRQLDSQINDVSLRNRAMQGLIEQEVLKQAAISQNYVISNRQIDNFLVSMPEFQENGKFSPDRFEQLLSASLYSPNEFLEVIHTSLLIDQPRLGIIFSSFALPNELANNIALLNQERNVQYVIFTNHVFANQNIIIPKEKILSYYQNHIDQFKAPEKVNLEYIELTLNDVMNTIKPTDQMIRNFYKENSSSYVLPNQTKSQKFEAVKDKVKQDLIRQLAEEKYATLKEKLSNLTYEHPESLQFASQTLNLPIKTTDAITREQGTNTLTQKQNVREAAFSNEVLNLNNNSDVIQITPENAIVLRIKKHNPATLLSLNEVENNIKQILKQQEIDIRTSQWVQQAYNQLQSGKKNLNEIALQNHLNVVSAGWTRRHSNKIEPAILHAAFALPKSTQKAQMALVKLGDNYAIVTVLGVRTGNEKLTSDQERAFAEQIQNSDGLMEYELYKQSLIERAKINKES